MVSENTAAGSLRGIPPNQSTQTTHRPITVTEITRVCKKVRALWKRQRLVLIPKACKTPGKSLSLRPVCLLNTDRVTQQRLVPFAEGEEGLLCHKYVFQRERRSTLDVVKLMMQSPYKFEVDVRLTQNTVL